MKYLFTCIILCSCLTLVSCNKSTLPVKTLSEKIMGKWKYSQSFYSIGGPLIYVSTEGLNQWIEYKADGTFNSNMPEFKNAISYTLIDSSKVRFNTPLQQPAFRLFFISFDSTDNTLSLSPADIICIEGCGDKFKR